MPSLHSEHVLDQLDAQREWGFLCDVLVSIGDTQFRAHRAVLAACSAFFRMLFIQSDCRGQQSVDLSHTGLSAHSFDRVLQYMYQGRVTTTDSLDFEDLKTSMQQLQMYYIPETLEELGRVQGPNSGTKLMFGVRMFPSRPGPEQRPEPRPETRPGLENRLGPETSSSTGNSRPISVEEVAVLAVPPVLTAPPLGEAEPCDLRRTLRKTSERLKERPRFGRTFTCDDCGFVFSCEKLLIEHILTCTNRKNPPQVQTRDQDQTRDQARDHARDHARLYHTDTESSPESSDTRVKTETEDWTRTEPGPAVTVKSEPDDPEPSGSHKNQEQSPDQDSAKRIKLEPGLNPSLDPGLDSGLDQDSDSRCELCGLELKGQDLSGHYLSDHTSHMCACGRCGQVLIKGRQLQEHAQRCAQNPDRNQDLNQNLSQDLSQDLSPDPNQTQDHPENPEEDSEEEDHEEEEMEACHLLDACENVGASLAGLVPAAFSLDEPRRRHFCGICGRGFFQRCHLREHYTVHTKHKQFTCLTCGKGFLRQRQLRLHQDMHRGVARYVCPVCEQGTFLKQDHVRHMITHLSPGETICQVCFQMFPGAEQLEQHMEVHLYVCSVCGDKFRLRKDMRTHCSTVHNKRV